jgi:hypothetical protein
MTEKGYQWGVKALQKRRAEIAGDIRQIKLTLKGRQADLRQIDDVLLILDPSADPAQIPARRKPPSHVNVFRQGQLNGLIMGLLKAAGRPMGNLEILAALMEQIGAPAAARESLRRRTNGNLHYLWDRDRIVKLAPGLWSLPRESTAAFRT